MTTTENAPLAATRLTADEVRAICSDETGSLRCICRVSCGDPNNPDCKQGIFLGGHEPDYFFKCTSGCCAHKPDDFSTRGCMFTGARFEKHGGMELRKKWKESIKCVNGQPIWSYLEATARLDPEPLLDRHIWVQWPLEHAGPTVFLGKIVHVDLWSGKIQVRYYYRHEDELPETLCLPAEVYRLLDKNFIPSRQQQLSIEERQLEYPNAQQQQYHFRPRQPEAQLSKRYNINKELFGPDDDESEEASSVISDSSKDSEARPASPEPSCSSRSPCPPHATAAAEPSGMQPRLLQTKRSAEVAGLHSPSDRTQSRRTPKHSTTGRLSPQQSRSPKGQVHAAVRPGRPTSRPASAAIPAQPAAAVPMNSAGISGAAVVAAAAAHADDLLTDARDKAAVAKAELSSWKQAVAEANCLGQLPQLMVAMHQNELVKKQQKYDRAEMTLTVHEEWSNYWRAALTQGRFA